MFDISHLTKVKHFPELLPGSDYYSAIAANLVAVPSPLDLRRFTNLAVELVDISLTADASIRAEIRADREDREIRTSSLDSATVYPFRFVARDLLSYGLRNTAATPVAGYRTVYGLWVYRPDVAQKILHRWPLTAEDEALAKELGIRDSVEKGVLPLPRTYVLEREYQVLNSMVFAITVDVPAAPLYETVLQVYAATDEFIVLRRFTCSNTLIANDVIMTFDRDDDIGYFTFRAAALGSLSGINCWIPARSELRVTASAVSAASGVTFTFEVLRCRMTNLLRARWGLASPDELPGDVWKKARGGIL